MEKEPLFIGNGTELEKPRNLVIIGKIGPGKIEGSWIEKDAINKMLEEIKRH